MAIGECDDIWANILADAEAGRLAPRYEAQLADLSGDGGRSRSQLKAINGTYDICSSTSCQAWDSDTHANTDLACPYTAGFMLERGGVVRAPAISESETVGVYRLSPPTATISAELTP